jgi:hypothetical protein
MNQKKCKMKKQLSLYAQPKIIVRNIDELVKGVPKADKLFIHFTKTQWTDITKGIKRGRKLPKRGVIFAFTPLPDGQGGIGSGECISDPCQICMSRVSKRIPDDFFRLECRCRPAPDEPGCPPIPKSEGNCRLVFRRQGLIWRMVCENINCTAGNCQINIVQDGLRWVIGCACQ